MLHARPHTRCFSRLSQRGTLPVAAIDAASFIPWVSVVVGSSGMLSLPKPSKFFGFGVLFNLCSPQTLFERPGPGLVWQFSTPAFVMMALVQFFHAAKRGVAVFHWYDR